MKTETLLQFGGLLHFAILSASALVPRVLDWKANLSALHPFLRQLFWVYGAFVVLMIVGFGSITLRYSAELASGSPLARGLCFFIAAFWLLRLAVQIFVFDCRAFLTNAWLVLGYHCLTIAFVVLAGIYGWAAFAGKETL